jgi:nucleoside-diphosphate-sugar epimerase
VFDEAVKGVDGVLHTASPFHFNTDGKAITALINPALKGTENMLQSCLKHGDKLKRVVITSSFAAILDTAKPVPQQYTEEDWNETSVKETERDGEAQERKCCSSPGARFRSEL